MIGRNFPSYRLRHSLRVWRARRYHHRNPMYYPPQSSSRPVQRPLFEEDVIRIPPSETYQQDDADG